ncbi:hypothetical protein ACFX12_032902 [Malus domestica]
MGAEIHVISSQTTRTTAPSVSFPPPVVEVSVIVRPDPMIEPAIDPFVKQLVTPAMATAHAKAGSMTATLNNVTSLTKKNLPPNPKAKPVVILEEEDDNSEEIPLMSHPRPIRLLTNNPPPVVKAIDQVDPPAADRGKIPFVEPKTTTETTIHLQDHNLGIPPQEVISSFVRLDPFLSLILL